MIAYQVRQSFKPGQITPEEANRIGYEFAERFLKGNHAFIICTHTGKHHIHNHIYWNSTTPDCTRKFRNFWGSTLAVRRLSVLICVQHRMSVIENPRPHGMSYNRWQGDIEKLSNRDQLCFNMDEALAKNRMTLQASFSLWSRLGIPSPTVKISHSAIRGRSAISVCALCQKNIRKLQSSPFCPARRFTIRANAAVRWRRRRCSLSSIWRKRKKQGRGHYYDLTIQNQITKQQAKALLCYQQHGFSSIDDFDAFSASVADCKKRRDELSAKITSAEKRMNEIAVLQKHITNYLKTKDVYASYRKSGYSKKYYEEHEDEIKLCKASKRAFDELLASDTSAKTADSHKKKLPSLKNLRAEYATLLSEKKAAYAEYYKAKDEYRELLTYQANLPGLFGIENSKTEPQKERQQEEK